jgi:hypothetical protein
LPALREIPACQVFKDRKDPLGSRAQKDRKVFRGIKGMLVTLVFRESSVLSVCKESLETVVLKDIRGLISRSRRLMLQRHRGHLHREVICPPTVSTLS